MDPFPDSSSALYTNLIIFGISLIACAIFSFLETSITSMRLFKLKEIGRTRPRYKKLLYTLENNPDRLLITILIATNLADVTAAMISSQIMETIALWLNIAGSVAFSLGIGITTAAILVFGQIIPKNIAKTHGDRFFGSTLWLTNLVFYLLSPFVNLLVKLSNFFVRLVGGRALEPGESITSEKEIQFLIDYINEKGLMEREKTTMLKSIFELGTTPVKEIMIPETEVMAISVHTELKDALQQFAKYPFSRLPVYEGEFDNIIGMLHQKDLFLMLLRNEGRPLRDIVRPIMFIPETIKVNQLLREFREQRMHIAMVINEYGSITGLVTLEDVLEEIVGDISDEYESVTPKIIPLKTGSWLVDASINLEDLGSLLPITFETEEALTLGGFLTEQMQHLPKKGEQITYKGYNFKIQKASPKRVFQVLIFEHEAPEAIETHDGISSLRENR